MVIGSIRLDDVGICACFQRLFSPKITCVCRYHDDGGISATRCFSHSLAKFQTIHLGHLQVGYNAMRLHVPDTMERISRRTFRVNGMPIQLENSCQDANKIRIIINYKYFQLFRHCDAHLSKSFT